MADNVLVHVLSGVATLNTGELDAVRDTVKDRREELKKKER